MGVDETAEVAMPAPDAAQAVQGGALAYWFDIAPEVRAEWLDWYQHDHMPSRIGTVFTAGRCYEAIAAQRSHMVLFETATAEALLAPSYLDLLKVVTPEDRARRGWYTGTIRVTCRVRARVGRGVGGVLGVLRIGGAGSQRGALADCLLHEVVPLLAASPRIGAVTAIEYDPAIRTRMDEVRVTGHQDATADWAVLVEAGHDDDLRTALALGSARVHASGLVAGATLDLERYRLLHTMTKDI